MAASNGLLLVVGILALVTGASGRVLLQEQGNGDGPTSIFGSGSGDVTLELNTTLGGVAINVDLTTGDITADVNTTGNLNATLGKLTACLNATALNVTACLNATGGNVTVCLNATSLTACLNAVGGNTTVPAGANNVTAVSEDRNATRMPTHRNITARGDHLANMTSDSTGGGNATTLAADATTSANATANATANANAAGEGGTMNSTVLIREQGNNGTKAENGGKMSPLQNGDKNQTAPVKNVTSGAVNATPSATGAQNATAAKNATVVSAPGDQNVTTVAEEDGPADLPSVEGLKNTSSAAGAVIADELPVEADCPTCPFCPEGNPARFQVINYLKQAAEVKVSFLIGPVKYSGNLSISPRLKEWVDFPPGATDIALEFPDCGDGVVQFNATKEVMGPGLSLTVEEGCADDSKFG